MRRVVLVSEYQGYTLDLDAKSVRGDFLAYGRSHGFFNSGDGSRRVVAQEDTLEFTVYGAENLQRLRQLAMQSLDGCTYRAFVFSDVEHVNWQQPVTMSLAPVGGTVVGARVSLYSSVVAGHVYMGENIVGGFPWHGATMTEVQTTDYRLTPPGHTTDTSKGWFVDAATTAPTMSGAGILTAQDASSVYLDWLFPCPGARVSFSITNKVSVTSRTLQALDFSGNAITSLQEGKFMTIPTGTWKLRLKVTGTDPYSFGQPEVKIATVGAAVGYRDGVSNPCGTTLATAPPWSS